MSGNVREGSPSLILDNCVFLVVFISLWQKKVKAITTDFSFPFPGRISSSSSGKMLQQSNAPRAQLKFLSLLTESNLTNKTLFKSCRFNLEIAHHFGNEKNRGSEKESGSSLCQMARGA